MVCEAWILEFMFRKRITNLEDLSEFLANEFPHEEVIMLIFDKLHLLREDPKKHAKEKLKNQTDKDGRPLFSIEVTGDIRIVYSFEQKIVLYSFGGLGGIRKLTVSSPNFLKR